MSRAGLHRHPDCDVGHIVCISSALGGGPLGGISRGRGRSPAPLAAAQGVQGQRLGVLKLVWAVAQHLSTS